MPINEGHAVDNEQHKLVHGTMGSETSNSSGSINFVMTKRFGGPNRSDETKKWDLIGPTRLRSTLA